MWPVANAKRHGGCIGRRVEIAGPRPWSPNEDGRLCFSLSRPFGTQDTPRGTSVQRSFALIGGQENSLALIGYSRSCVLVDAKYLDGDGTRTRRLPSRLAGFRWLNSNPGQNGPTRREILFGLERDDRRAIEGDRKRRFTARWGTYSKQNGKSVDLRWCVGLELEMELSWYERTERSDVSLTSWNSTSITAQSHHQLFLLSVNHRFFSFFFCYRLLYSLFLLLKFCESEVLLIYKA